MASCPNKNSKKWKDLVESVGERNAYKLWLENGEEIPGVPNISLDDQANIIDTLQEAFKIDVIINNDMDLAGRVIKRSATERPLIEVNTNLLQEDTVVHEFAHIYIDLLGGMQSPQVRAGIKQLQGSALETKIRNLYPEINEEDFQKELLATAIGLEGAKIFGESQSAAPKKFDSWLKTFFMRIKTMLGIPQNVAQKLAKEMISNTVNKKTLVGTVKEGVYEQRVDPTTPDEKKLSKKEQLVNRALAKVKSQVEESKRRLDPTNKEAAKGLAAFQKLQKDLERLVTDKALIQYVNTANAQTKAAQTRLTLLMKDKKPSLSKLNALDVYVKSFDSRLLTSIQKELEATEGLEEESAVIDDIAAQKRTFDRRYADVRKTVLASTLAPSYNKIEAMYRRDAQRAFGRQKDKNLKGKSLEEARQEFVSDYIAKNREKIAKETQDKVESFFSIINKDISIADSFLTNPKDLNSEILSYVNEMLDMADFKTQQETVKKFRSADALFVAYTDQVGKHQDQAKQWEPILEFKDGVATGKIVEPSSAKGKEIKQGKYKSTAVEDMYDFILKTSEERDKNLLPSYRLGLTLPSINKGLLERTAENGVVSTIRQEVKDTFKVRAEDTEFGELQEESTNLMPKLNDVIETLTNQAGQERQFVPVNFRGKMEQSDKSLDVLSSLLLDHYQSLNFTNKGAIAPTLDAIKQEVAEADVLKRAGMNGILKTMFKSTEVIKTKGSDSNVYKALESVLQNRLYGIKIEGDPQVAKIASSIKSYVSHVSLIGNWLSAGANFTQGHAMNFLEAVGGQFYTKRNLASAVKKRELDLVNVMKDIGARRPGSRTNLLIEKFNAFSDWTAVEHKFADNNKAKQVFNTSSLHGFNHMAEHAVQSIMMYATLDNIKVKNAKGEFIDKDGNVVERDKAMSLDESYELGYQNIKTGKDISASAYGKLTAKQKEAYTGGVLVMNEHAASHERSDEIDTADDTFKVSRLIKRINRNAFGNYDSENKSKFERYAVGSLVMHMRGWLIPGLKKRWKGQGTLFIKDGKGGFRIIKKEELREVDLDFNQETGEFEEGTYITTMRFVNEIMKDLMKLKFDLVSKEWNTLTDNEKANIKQSLTEAGLIVLSLIITSVLKAAADDDDDEVMLAAAFFSRRLYSELFTYSNPMEAIRTMRSPAISLSLAENIIRAGTQLLTDPMATYENGQFVGESKLKNKLINVSVLKSINRNVDSQLDFLLK